MEDRRVEQVRLFEGGVSMLKTHDFSRVGERTEGWMEDDRQSYPPGGTPLYARGSKFTELPPPPSWEGH